MRSPRLEVADGKEYPAELLYGRRMTECLEEYAPDASEALQLAARCQHIRRWEIPRESFPNDRKGYLLWRTKLKDMHASVAAAILRENGYSENVVEKVQKLLKKKGLKTDGDVQTLEDVICIVFLKYYFNAFAPKHEAEKIKSILSKTINKMSKKGIEYAKKLENSASFLTYLE